MFTVKHRQASGHEELITARRVSLQPAVPPGEGNSGGISETVHIENMDGETTPYTEGTFFVMNDAGSTVARYHLGAPKVKTFNTAGSQSGC